MPRLACWFIRASLAYLLAGFSLGAIMLALKATGHQGMAIRGLVPHVDFLLIGWTVQLTMGVAFWILPRLEGGVSRGAVAPASLAFVLLNAGVLLVALASVQTLASAETMSSGRLVGRAAEVAAALAFAVHAWRRIRAASVDAQVR
jgi:hypothetical protein